MKLQLNNELNIKLRNVINERHNFTYDKKADFKSPKNKKSVEANAYNCICAALDQIGDLVKHLNSLDIKDVFGLCDVLNYGQTLIDCITIIGKIYHIEYKYEDCSIFEQPGSDNKGSDEKYYKYLRSLCAVHPIETTYYREYQGNEPEWCAYIQSASSIAYIFNKQIIGADFVATVYRNDMKNSKNIPIKVNQIIKYIEKRYSFINEVIEAVKKYNNDKIKELKNRKIRLPEEFSNYGDYLKTLQEEIGLRCSNMYKYRAREWLAIMNSNYNDADNNRILCMYKSALKKGIEKIHVLLQNMEIDNYFEVEPIEYNHYFIPPEYRYSLEKINYLCPSYIMEDIDKPFMDIINDCEKCDDKRIDEMLNIIDTAQKDGKSQDDMSDIMREIDMQFKVTNSEWARIQLKNIEPFINDIINIDYHLNDWYLYLQVQMAFWLKSNDKEGND